MLRILWMLRQDAVGLFVECLVVKCVTLLLLLFFLL